MPINFQPRNKVELFSLQNDMIPIHDDRGDTESAGRAVTSNSVVTAGLHNRIRRAVHISKAHEPFHQSSHL